jgi:GNAT superfamily N-acetyltransferase
MPSADLPRQKIETLSALHELADFDCGVRRINDYLRLDGIILQKNDLARLYVAVASGSRRVLGYYALHNHYIDGQYVSGPLGLTLRRDAVVGCAYLAMLGVDRRCQGQRIGSRLLADALRRCRRLAQEIGLWAVVLDAVDDQAIEFYGRFGFMSLKGRHRLYLPISRID